MFWFEAIVSVLVWLPVGRTNVIAKAVLDCLCLVNFAAAESFLFEALERLSTVSYTWFSEPHDAADSANFDLVLRLYKTILRTTAAKFGSDSEGRCRISRAYAELACALLPLIKTSTTAVVRRTRQSHPSLDVRSALMDILIFVTSLSHDPLIVYRGLIACVKGILLEAQSGTSDALSNLAARQSADHCMTLLASLPHLEDTEGQYEQQLVRSFHKYGKLERDLWILGIVKDWIKLR